MQNLSTILTALSVAAGLHFGRPRIPPGSLGGGFCAHICLIAVLRFSIGYLYIDAGMLKISALPGAKWVICFELSKK